MPRVALVCTVLALLALAPAARAQDNPFGPLPAAPTDTATPAPTAAPTSSSSSGQTGTTTLLLIGGALPPPLLRLGPFLAPDAPRRLPEDKRPPAAVRDGPAPPPK